MQDIICTACPMGCRLKVGYDEQGKLIVTGNTCKRGEVYGAQEFLQPERTVTTTVRVENGIIPVVSVRTAAPVAKAETRALVERLKKVSVRAPVSIGTVLLHDAATDTDIVATADIAAS